MNPVGPQATTDTGGSPTILPPGAPKPPTPGQGGYMRAALKVFVVLDKVSGYLPLAPRPLQSALDTGEATQGYVNAGVDQTTAVIAAVTQQLPITRSIWAGWELYDGRSLAGADLSRPLSTGDKVFRGVTIGVDAATLLVPGAVAKATKYKPGTFSIRDWSGYPKIPKPTGVFRLLKGAEKRAARCAANKGNAAIRRGAPAKYAGKEIHEIKPVKFGGSPTASANKIALPANFHRRFVTPWWNRLLQSLQGNGGG